MATATLADGGTLSFEDEMIGEGGMKQVFLTTDRRSVVCFFRDKSASRDPQRRARLEAVVTRYNPTTDAASGDYWRRLFCWPTGIVNTPELGLVAPKYPPNFFFASGPFAGKEKQGRWFSSPKLRAMLPEHERGTWRNYLSICILIARAVRRLHQAGLAHSDLSSKNVLVDPVSGHATVIDIDSLVVPGLFPPDVLGTPGYIAPEVLATQHLPLDDLNRQSPSARTDQHALAVLIYEYLLFRHPLRGPKINSSTSAEEDERQSMGENALFIEHPADKRNRPKDLGVSCDALGPLIANLFRAAFVSGLHAPNSRPAAMEWERALVKTWDQLVPCRNAACSHKMFVLHNSARPICPFCQTRLKGSLPLLKLLSERRPGQWIVDGQVLLHQDKALCGWHTKDNVFPGEQADRTPQAICAVEQGAWVLLNRALPSMTSPSGNRVLVGQAVALKDGAHFRLSNDPHGRMASVQVLDF